MGEILTPKKSNLVIYGLAILGAFGLLGLIVFGYLKITKIQKDIEDRQTRSSNITKGRVWMDRATKAHDADNHDREIEHLLKSASFEYHPAIRKIAKNYDTGDHVTLSYQKAREWYRKLPEKEYRQYLAYRGYELGYPQKSLEQSRIGIEFLEEALTLGDEKRRENLAWVYSRSYPELRDYEKAESYYTLIGGKPELEFLNYRGWQLKELGDFDQAKGYFRRAIDLGSPHALINMAYSYQDDHEDEDGQKTAEEFMKQAVNVKNKETRYEASLYFLQFGEETARPIGLETLEGLANEDYDKAKLELARIYTEGQHFPFDYEKAVKHLETATFLTAKAKLTLAHMKRIGTGISRDLKSAFTLYSEASEAGNPEATMALAHMHRLGLGTKKDPHKAKTLYENIRHNPRHPASYYIGLMYEKGDFGPSNGARAIELYRLASEAEYGPALRQLALKYEIGDGVTKNTEQAFKFMIEAAYSDDKQAIENLARYYSRGIGTDISSQYAAIWRGKKPKASPFSFEE